MAPDEQSAKRTTGPRDVYGVVTDVLAGRPLIIVTNREPYEHVRRDGRIVERKTIGGVTSALEPMMQSIGGTWIAWGSGDADREVVDATDTIRMPAKKPAYGLRRIWLSKEEVEDFYNGHVNQTLWPLCHLQTEKVRFLRKEWAVYQDVNRRFAEAAAGEGLEKESVVWFQDYHFALAPAMLRQKRPDMTIMQFWHIPWPPWEVFRQHPERRALLEGLLGCDLIGMHIDLYCTNFLECVERELGIPVDNKKGNVLLGDRTIRVRALPLSVDAAAFDTQARSAATESHIQRLRQKFDLQGQKLAVSVERGDYTKGILLRLHALDAFFRRYPEWKGKFTLLQITPLSRETIPAYQIFAKEMNRLVRELNDAYGDASWRPVIHIKTAVPQKELVSYFRIADVAIVSVRHDGMNLVAKEYVASRADGDGVLMLSEFAGAAEEMHQAVIINPYDLEGFTEALNDTLLMPVEERRLRMRQLRDAVFNNTVFDWIIAVFRQVESLSGNTAELSTVPLLSNLDRVQELGKRRGHIALFCDYDGVLAPIASRPNEAKLDQHVRDLLGKIRDSGSVHVSIISGRGLNDLSDLVSVERLTYAGNHGLQISGPRTERFHPDAQRVHGVMRQLYEDLREAMRRFPGVIVEDKQLGVAMHYRLAEPASIDEITNTFYKLVDTHNAGRVLRITTGKCLLEVRPNVEWDKGRAVLWLLESLHGPHWKDRVLPIYLGDDVTDEDAFRAINGNGATVQVGYPPPGGTIAEFHLDNTGEVTVFLEWLTRAFP